MIYEKRIFFLILKNSNLFLYIILLITFVYISKNFQILFEEIFFRI